MYEFTEDCMLHIDAIDEEHKRLFQMINEAFDLVEKDGHRRTRNTKCWSRKSGHYGCAQWYRLIFQ